MISVRRIRESANVVNVGLLIGSLAIARAYRGSTRNSGPKFIDRIARALGLRRRGWSRFWPASLCQPDGHVVAAILSLAAVSIMIILISRSLRLPPGQPPMTIVPLMDAGQTTPWQSSLGGSTSTVTGSGTLSKAAPSQTVTRDSTEGSGAFGRRSATKGISPGSQRTYVGPLSANGVGNRWTSGKRKSS